MVAYSWAHSLLASNKYLLRGPDCYVASSSTCSSSNNCFVSVSSLCLEYIDLNMDGDEWIKFPRGFSVALLYRIDVSIDQLRSTHWCCVIDYQKCLVSDLSRGHRVFWLFLWRLHWLRGSGARFLSSPDEFSKLFRRCQIAVHNTVVL